MTIEPVTDPSSGRPQYHVTAPRGWINDPCAPGYDFRTGLYHLFYQWNPHSHVWDNISWGHAVSKDMITWEHDSETTPTFVPDSLYDSQGIFTGCFYPTGPHGEESQLSVFYSSVNYLPITWSQPYKRGCEGLAMAASADGGKTWNKHAANPILAEEPPDIHVTGFRDPFIAPWPLMDELRGSKPMLYGLVSGGVHGKGPRTFLYAIDPADLTKWTYLHPLVEDLKVNHVPDERWSGDLGANWECTNFVTLKDDRGTSQIAVISGAEGGHERPWVSAYHDTNPSVPRRVPRYANWFFGDLEARQDGQVRLALGAAGMLDWGIFYAASTFTDPEGRTIVWGWIIEEDLADAPLAKKGWTGCMGVPREAFLLTLNNVVGALSSQLSTIGSLETDTDGSTVSVKTLGIRPIPALVNLRGSLLFDFSPSPLKPSKLCRASAPLACEISAMIHVFDATQRVTLHVRHSEDMSTGTSIIFDCKEERITVDRSRSTDRKDVNVCPEIGSNTLFRLANRTSDIGELEPLRLRVFLDHDVIEIFANDRFALSTRVYTDNAHTGISLASVGGGWVEELKVWDVGSIHPK